MITRDNYETYFVDYLDGNLPEDQIDQFLDFLKQNPDLKEELHLFEEVVLPEEKLVFHEKEQLRKSTSDETLRFENKAIAYLEGDMDIHESKAFGSYLTQHPALQNEYKQFEKTRLVPDLSVQYAAKSKLYHKPVRTVVMNWVARAAAVVALVWGINSLIQTPNKPELAQNKIELSAAKPEKIQPETSVKPASPATTSIQEKEKVREKISPIKTKESNGFVQQKEEKKQPVTEKETTEAPLQLAEILPINAKIETVKDLRLAVKQTNNITRINEAQRVVSVEEFLAMRAKKVGKEGLFSAQRLARLGLSVASEISGERIGYTEKDGKITSVEFESKLMAFSIPLEKK
jgi:hypothetical protein